jgi:hypothetical protein
MSCFIGVRVYNVSKDIIVKFHSVLMIQNGSLDNLSYVLVIYGVENQSHVLVGSILGAYVILVNWGPTTFAPHFGH